MALKMIVSFLLFALCAAGPLTARADMEEDIWLDEILIDGLLENFDPAQEDLPPVEESPEEVPPAEPQMISAEEMKPYEESGSYHTIIGGSLGKALWKDQDREDITPLLKALKPDQPFPGMQKFKTRLSLTAAEMDDVDSPDILEQGEDFLTIRLQKLIANGWYDEAYKLYTDSVKTPPHEKLAEIGVLLILYNGDLPTACLEEKVIAANYMDRAFFKKLDSACALELGYNEDITALTGSDTLLSVFTDELFSIPALDTRRLSALTPLERGLVFAKSRIQYDANLFTPDIIATVPSDLLMLYRRDKTLPDQLKIPFLREALERDLISPATFRKADEDYQRIEKTEDEAEKATALTEKLSTELSLPVLAAYSPLLMTYNPEKSEKKDILKIISIFLYAGKDIPDVWIERLREVATLDFKNYVYLQIVSALTGNKENLEKNKVFPLESENIIFPDHFGQALAILESLNRKKMLDEQLLIVYEKQSSLTEPSDYGMDLDSLEKDIKTPARKEQSGLTVLNVLKALDARITETPPSVISVTLSSLKNVGYIDDVQMAAQRGLAEIIFNKKGE